MLPEKFKAIIKKRKSQYTHSFFLPDLNTLQAFCSLLNILLNRFSEHGSSPTVISSAFSFANFSFLLSSLAYSFSSKNEAVEINYKA